MLMEIFKTGETTDPSTGGLSMTGPSRGDEPALTAPTDSLLENMKRLIFLVCIKI